MNNKKITIIFIMIAISLLLGIVGLTMAYFTSSTDFENEFTTGFFQTEATETFTSPQNWMPGDTTPKTLTIKNTGNVDVKARVCINESWESANGDILDNEVNGERVAILNLANTSDWTGKGNCYEYNDILESNDETSTFISGVTFNPEIEADIVCTTSGNTKTCTSSGDGYDNATYTLTFTVETVQANAANKQWTMYFANRQDSDYINSGDELVIDTEHFYVVNSDSNKTVLLAKNNLLVGEVINYNDSTGMISSVRSLNNSDTGYGLQSSNAYGYNPEDGITEYELVGVVPFSGTNYWNNSECEFTESNYNCNGTDYTLSEYEIPGGGSPRIYNSTLSTIQPVYYSEIPIAQNNGYTIAYYVENYVNKLKELGAPNTITGRLLTHEEYIDYCNKTTCDAYNKHWINSTSYWLEYATSYQNVAAIVNYQEDLDTMFVLPINGVRPVIEIPTSDIHNSTGDSINETIVYTSYGVAISIGDSLPDIDIHDNPEEVINSNDNPIFIKYVLNNYIVSEKYLGFYISDYYAQNYGVKPGIHYLSLNESNYYAVENKLALADIFGRNNCSTMNNSYHCQVETINVGVNNTGWTYAHVNSEIES